MSEFQVPSPSPSKPTAIHLAMDNLFERTLLGEITRAEGLKYIDSMVRTLMHGLKKRDTGN